ncbi:MULTISPECIES: DUF4396 domain-containing protein [Acidocellaceae]|uniref:Integral membrane protein n=2 Tax=Acidocella TaxID=50709 RepID=A0A0D6PF71_9PROT|nr:MULTISPECIES: DUF4396 domain-containing protein [Acetobacteraceae]GAN79853.1 integral membrane protein [Acidocella aminolytica 101 = DSM 11237]GBQ32358.1 hypothetical protein AA11237_0138 [Acidocella aminolytica 101 = DSM 11237]SHF25235.1 protein of unknown function [Acidocella aminolytica 101 = DSM 11237]
MIPLWLTIVSILSLIAAFSSAALIIIDLRKRPQPMAVMNPVWPITALYFGPIGLWAYYALGRAAKPQSAEMSGHNGHHHHDGSDQPFWISTFIGSTHCGAGCTLGDIIAEFLVFFTGAAFVGSTFGTELVLDYVFAFTLGVAFQYFSIAPMRGLGLKDGIIAAVKADFLSLTAFEVGLFGWMALMRFVFFGPHLHPDSPVYWFMMQIGMIIGFATTYPMNWFLVRAGIKEAM